MYIECPEGIVDLEVNIYKNPLPQKQQKKTQNQLPEKTKRKALQLPCQHQLTEKIPPLPPPITLPLTTTTIQLLLVLPIPLFWYPMKQGLRRLRKATKLLKIMCDGKKWIKPDMAIGLVDPENEISLGKFVTCNL